MSRYRVFTTGSRRDSADGKPPLSKLPWTALSEVAFVHQYGDDHYGIGNWRKGQNMSTFLDSCDRHKAAFAKGEDYDPKSGRHHMAHAAWNCLIALHQSLYPDRYAELDDRMTDFGEWVNELFAQTEQAKLLVAGDVPREDVGNGEADPVNVKAPQDGGSVAELEQLATGSAPAGTPARATVTDEMLSEG